MRSGRTAKDDEDLASSTRAILGSASIDSPSLSLLSDALLYESGVRARRDYVLACPLHIQAAAIQSVPSPPAAATAAVHDDRGRAGGLD